MANLGHFLLDIFHIILYHFLGVDIVFADGCARKRVLRGGLVGTVVELLDHSSIVP